MIVNLSPVFKALYFPSTSSLITDKLRFNLSVVFIAFDAVSSAGPLSITSILHLPTTTSPIGIDVLFVVITPSI